MNIRYINGWTSIITNVNRKNRFSFTNLLIIKPKKTFFIIILASFLFFICVKNFVIGKRYNIIHLATSTDNNYIYQTIVFLTSLLDNRANSTFYNIYILTDNSVTKESKDKINTIITKFGNNHSSIKFYNVEEKFKNLYVSFLSFINLL